MKLKSVLRKTTELGLGLVAITTLALAGCGGGSTSVANNSGTPFSGLMGGAKQGTALNLTTTVTTFAGIAGALAGATNGASSVASFSTPGGITTDGSNLYVADENNHLIRKISIASGVVSTVAGGATWGAADGIATAASFWGPRGITTDGTNLYVADTFNGCVRKIVIATSDVVTLAGPCAATSAGAPFNRPGGITTDGTNLYVADTLNNNIKKIVIATGAVSTLAGAGASGVGATATFSNPMGITTDGSNLYVADETSNTIRKVVIATGATNILAGPGAATAAGAAATFNGPYGITTDGTNLYVAEYFGNLIHQIIIATGAVSTLAGSGTAGANNASGVAATFNQPGGITTDGTSLYVSDTTNNAIRKIQ